MVNLFLCLTKYYAMYGGVDRFIFFYLSTHWRWVVRFASQWLFVPGNSLRYTLDGGLDGSYNLL
jgi:hypothetical protein